MRIAIFPGSFKPPHIGHFYMLENLILQKKPYQKILILISSKPRPLSPDLYKIDTLPITDIKNLLYSYDSSIYTKSFTTKKQYIEEYKKLILKNKIPVITAQQSLQIWKIYKSILEKKYHSIIQKEKIEIFIEISMAPSPLLSCYQFVTSYLKKKIPQKNITLVKSKKNQKNTRFDYLLKKYPDLHVKVVSSKHPFIHSMLFRKAILDKNKKEIQKYIPDEIPKNEKNKILHILNSSLSSSSSSSLSSSLLK
jgi:hypothetical protein